MDKQLNDSKGSKALETNRIVFQIDTSWKIYMEPTNHPFRKENDLPNLHDYVPC